MPSTALFLPKTCQRLRATLSACTRLLDSPLAIQRGNVPEHAQLGGEGGAEGDRRGSAGKNAFPGALERESHPAQVRQGAGEGGGGVQRQELTGRGRLVSVYGLPWIMRPLSHATRGGLRG